MTHGIRVHETRNPGCQIVESSTGRFCHMPNFSHLASDCWMLMFWHICLNKEYHGMTDNCMEEATQLFSGHSSCIVIFLASLSSAAECWRLDVGWNSCARQKELLKIQCECNKNYAIIVHVVCIINWVIRKAPFPVPVMAVVFFSQLN